MKPNRNRLTLVKIFIPIRSLRHVDLGKDHVSCLSITDRHAPPRSGTKTFALAPARVSISRDRSRTRATRQILLDNSDQIETACRLRNDTMAVDATTIARFFRRD